MRGYANNLPFAMEDAERKDLVCTRQCANILVRVIHIYGDAITAYIIPHVSSQGSQSFVSSSLPLCRKPPFLQCIPVKTWHNHYIEKAVY